MFGFLFTDMELGDNLIRALQKFFIWISDTDMELGGNLIRAHLRFFSVRDFCN